MKLLKHLLLFTLIMTCVALSQDSTKSKFEKFEVSVSGGMSYPYIPEDFNKRSERGYHIGGEIGALMVPGDLGYSAVCLTFDYNRFKANRDEYVSIDSLAKSQWMIDAGNVSLVTVQLNYKGTLTLNDFFINPYFQFGVGMEYFIMNGVTMANGTTPFAKEDVSRTAFAWNIGAGLDVPLNDQLKVFVEGGYFLAVGVESRAQHFTTSMGLRIGF